jgi:nucleoside permease NupC
VKQYFAIESVKDLLYFRSEIHAVMTGGFATIAGTVLGAYIG